MTLRHNKLRDDIGEMLHEVTNDVRIEPILQTLTGEKQSKVETYQSKHALISPQEGFGIVDRGHFLM